MIFEINNRYYDLSRDYGMLEDALQSLESTQTSPLGVWTSIRCRLIAEPEVCRRDQHQR